MDQIGRYLGYLIDMFSLINWASPWVWLVAVALFMAFKAANH